MQRSLFWLSDEQWLRIEPYLPRDLCGPARVHERRVISGVLYVLRAGCGWRDCPPEYGSRAELIDRFLGWEQFGIWERLFRDVGMAGEKSKLRVADLRSKRPASTRRKRRSSRLMIGRGSSPGVRASLRMPEAVPAVIGEPVPSLKNPLENAAALCGQLALGDAMWARMAPHIIGDGRGRGAIGRDNRMFVEGVLWIARTGSPWRDLPVIFGEWNSVFRRFCRWGEKGVWRRIFAAMADDVEFDYLILDDEIIHASRLEDMPVNRGGAE